MAQSDRKKARYRGGGGYKQPNYDAENRADSKRAYDYITSMDDVKATLDSMGDHEFLRLIKRMSKISRYGMYDLERVLGNLSTGDANAIRERIKRVEGEQREQDKARMAENEKRWEAQQALRNIELEQEANAYRQTASLTAGMLHSDCHDVYEMRDKTEQYYGDWMDDPVSLVTGGDGWGRSVKEKAGIVLQITLSLDVSNSMWHNKIAKAAIKAFIELGMALDELSETFPGSVYVHQFLFALNGSTDQDSGKISRPLLRPNQWSAENDGKTIGKYEQVRDWLDGQPYNAGEDTWIAPLFKTIEQWEENYSDPGAVRLDLVLTDAVLEHPFDVREASQIQERRDGALQTILLNFLDEEEWLNSPLPGHCVQYPANGTNVAGLLRRLLGEFVSVYY